MLAGSGGFGNGGVDDPLGVGTVPLQNLDRRRGGDPFGADHFLYRVFGVGQQEHLPDMRVGLGEALGDLRLGLP